MEFLAQFHPKIVHFPIALFITYAFLEATAVVWKKDFIRNAAFLLLGLGVLSALAALFTGNQAASMAEKWDEAGVKVISAIPFQVMRHHEEWATITTWWFTGLLILRVLVYLYIQRKNRYPQFKVFAFPIIAILALVGCYFLFETGEHGGHLVYKKGVGTELIRPDTTSAVKEHEE
ncbi:MAG: hypothetical protein LWX56_03180 [Ignavibacteria bacterium]|nr:hypothetical protein [Ignavibacteria bacterium]